MTRHAGDGGSCARSCRSKDTSPSRPQGVNPGPGGMREISPPILSTGVNRRIGVPRRQGVQNVPFGGFSFRAAGSARVQIATFAGVFVPQAWNRQAYQSASRLCPIGARLRLHHRVTISFHRCNSPCKLMYTSPTSPKDPRFPCIEGRRLQGPPFRTLHLGLPSANLMTARTTLSPSTRKSPTAAQNASGFLEPNTPLCRTKRRCGRRPRAWLHT